MDGDLNNKPVVVIPGNEAVDPHKKMPEGLLTWAGIQVLHNNVKPDGMRFFDDLKKIISKNKFVKRKKNDGSNEEEDVANLNYEENFFGPYALNLLRGHNKEFNKLKLPFTIETARVFVEIIEALKAEIGTLSDDIDIKIGGYPENAPNLRIQTKVKLKAHLIESYAFKVVSYYFERNGLDQQKGTDPYLLNQVFTKFCDSYNRANDKTDFQSMYDVTIGPALKFNEDGVAIGKDYNASFYNFVFGILSRDKADDILKDILAKDIYKLLPKDVAFDIIKKAIKNYNGLTPDDEANEESLTKVFKPVSKKRGKGFDEEKQKLANVFLNELSLKLIKIKKSKVKTKTKTKTGEEAVVSIDGGDDDVDDNKKKKKDVVNTPKDDDDDLDNTKDAASAVVKSNSQNDAAKKDALKYLQEHVLAGETWGFEKRFCLFRGGKKVYDNTDPAHKGKPELVPTQVQNMRVWITQAVQHERAQNSQDKYQYAYGESIKAGLRMKAQTFRYIRGRRAAAIDLYDNILDRLHVDDQRSLDAIKEFIDKNIFKIDHFPKEIRCLVGEYNDFKWSHKPENQNLTPRAKLERVLYCAMDFAENNSHILAGKVCERITDHLCVDETKLAQSNQAVLDKAANDVADKANANNDLGNAFNTITF